MCAKRIRPHQYVPRRQKVSLVFPRCPQCAVIRGFCRTYCCLANVICLLSGKAEKRAHCGIRHIKKRSRIDKAEMKHS
jgi:hypothetical protein